MSRGGSAYHRLRVGEADHPADRGARLTRPAHPRQADPGLCGGAPSRPGPLPCCCGPGKLMTNIINLRFQYRDAIFPDFSGFPDFHRSKLSMKNL